MNQNIHYPNINQPNPAPISNRFSPAHSHQPENPVGIFSPSQQQPIIYPGSWQPNDQNNQVEMSSSQVELSLSCHDLPNADVITKSDPQVIVYQIDVGREGKKCEIGRTEVINDDLNPKFAKKIIIQYHFEQIQKLRFEVLDIDPIGGHDFLGYLETTLAEIITCRSSSFKQALVGGPRKRPGYLIIDVEEMTSCKQVAYFNLRAMDLPSSYCGLFRPSASVHIYRSNENGNLNIVHRSPIIRANCNPQFNKFQLKLVTICNGDLDRSIRFELMDERFGLQRNLGFFETTINSLKSSCRFDKNKDQVFELISPAITNKSNKKKTDSQVSSSKAILSDFKLTTQATFLDYIRAGAQIHFVIAIDFTGSNGDPALTSSLHHLDPFGRHLNPYEASLLAVGNILKPYDTTGMFAGFGFGAKLNGPSRPPSHLFPLNGNQQHPYVTSIDELLKVYRSKINDVILSGPTNFAPCIEHCNTIARQFDDGNHYFVLLIVTDGIISDMTQTKRAIVEASKSPVSIIICGVGDAEFTAMNELDSDDSLLKVDGKLAERDIVQFVPMNQFLPDKATQQNNALGSLGVQQLLAEEVLREIPDQLTGYMTLHGFHSDLTYVDSNS